MRWQIFHPLVHSPVAATVAARLKPGAPVPNMGDRDPSTLVIFHYLPRGISRTGWGLKEPGLGWVL